MIRKWGYSTMHPFEHFRRLHEIMEKANLPLREWQRHSELIKDFSNQNRILQEIQDKHEIMIKSVLPSLAGQNTLQWDALKANGLLEPLYYPRWLDQLNLATADLAKISDWQNTLDKLAQSSLLQSSMFVPSYLLDQLDELTSEIEATYPKQEGSSDLASQLTVQVPETNKVTNEKRDGINWPEFFATLVAIMSIISNYHIASLGNVQQAEQMVEEKKQTALMEQQLIIDSQRLQIEREQITIAKEQLAHQEALEKKYDELLGKLDLVLEEQKDEDSE